MENWKPVKNYEDYYEVSDLGRIRSVTRRVNASINNNDSVIKKGKVLKLSLKRNGYYSFDASKDGVTKTVSVHKAIAMAFIPNHDNKPCINHKNAIKTDNRIDNLEWVTYKENSQHASDLDLFPKNNAKKLKCSNGKEFESSIEAAKWLNETFYMGSKSLMTLAKNIRRSSCGGRNSAYGYGWKDIN